MIICKGLNRYPTALSGPALVKEEIIARVLFKYSFQSVESTEETQVQRRNDHQYVTDDE